VAVINNAEGTTKAEGKAQKGWRNRISIGSL